MVEYRINSQSRSKYILYPFLKLMTAFTFGAIIGVILFKVGTSQILVIVLLALLWCSLIHLLPFFIIAIRHLKFNRNAVFYVEKQNEKFRYKDDKLDLPFEIDQIEKVICAVSPPKNDRRLDLLGFGHFFYWRIVLKSGLTLQLSCMLMDDDVFFGKPIEYKKELFPMPSFKYRSAAG